VARIGPAANAKQNKKVFKLSSTGWRLVNAVHDRAATTDVNRFAKRAGSRTGSQSRFAPFHGAVERAGIESAGVSRCASIASHTIFSFSDAGDNPRAFVPAQNMD
jgi:hypothetical protein